MSADAPQDRVLDWCSGHDPRSRNYGFYDAVDKRDLKPPQPKFWQPGQVLDQGQEGACFPEGTLIRMSDGSQRAIEDVRLLDEVVTAEGRIGRVLQLMARDATELVSIHIRGHLSLRCTPNHPVLTESGYVAAEELAAGSKVAITRFTACSAAPVEPYTLVDVRELRGTKDGLVNTGGVLTQVSPMPAVIAKTPAFGRLLGLYAAEGSTTANKVVWTFGKHEKETLVPETVGLIKGSLGVEARVQIRPNNCATVVLYGKCWRLLFESLVPGTTKHGNKRLSEHITSGPDDYLKAILDGWLAGDGYRRRQEHLGVSVCKRLSLDMHAIANGLGLKPCIRHTRPVVNKHAKTRQWRYDLSLPQGDSANGRVITDAAMWRSVTSVEREAFEGVVYNMHVEGDESYVADGVGVHNCVGFGWTGELLAQPFTYSEKIGGECESFAHSLYQMARAHDKKLGWNWKSGASVIGGARAIRQLRFIGEFRWAMSMEELRDAVINEGPVVIGIPWLEGMYQTRPSGLVEVSGKEVGGHCLTITGYHPSMRIAGEGYNKRFEVFRWVNSWGRDYGRDGTGLVTMEDLARLLKGRGEACIPMRRSAITKLKG